MNPNRSKRFRMKNGAFPPDDCMGIPRDEDGSANELGEQAIGQPITGYHTDDQGHWVARLACGHNQHVRHDPPLVSRPWVTTADGRRLMLGYKLNCKKCLDGTPADERPNPSETDA